MRLNRPFSLVSASLLSLTSPLAPLSSALARSPTPSLPCLACSVQCTTLRATEAQSLGLRLSLGTVASEKSPFSHHASEPVTHGPPLEATASEEGARIPTYDDATI